MDDQKKSVLKPSPKSKQSIFKSVLLNPLFPALAKDLAKLSGTEIDITNHIGTSFTPRYPGFNLKGDFLFIEIVFSGSLKGEISFLIDKGLREKFASKKSEQSKEQTQQTDQGVVSPEKTTTPNPAASQFQDLASTVEKTLHRTLLKLISAGSVAAKISKIEEVSISDSLSALFPQERLVLIQSDLMLKGVGEWTFFTVFSYELASKLIHGQGEDPDVDIENFSSSVEGLSQAEDQINILIVEDSQPVRNVMKIMLEKANYKVFAVSNPTEAISLVENHNFDLALLDVMMPMMDGFTLAKKLRENPKSKDLPIVFCTAKGSRENVAEGIRSGAVDYLVKPFAKETLLQKVGNLVKHDKKATVLSVDDDPSIRNIIRVVLTKAGYHVITAANAEEAKELIKGKPIDIILLDVMMPVTDGYQLASYIKGDPAYKDVKIIFCTVKDRAEDKDYANKMEIDGYITKPFTKDSLISEIQQVLSSKK